MPIIDHAIRVAGHFDPLALPARVVAVLHDVVEDTGVTLSEILARFGPDIAIAIDALTRRDGEVYFDYITRVGRHPLAKQVKIADLKDHLDPARIGMISESLVRRYAKALTILVGA